MPRTKAKKQTANAKENIYTSACSHLEKKFSEQLAGLDWERNKGLSKIEMDFAYLRTKYASLLPITIKELMNATTQNSTTVISDLIHHSLLSSIDEGYLTTESMLTESKSKVNFSAISNNSMKKTNNDIFKTPLTMISKQDALSLGYVTPKVKPHQPMTVIRRAREGEMIISMSGSPILVNTAPDDKPNVNVPLGNGRVLTVQPVRGIRLSEIPEIDEETRENLIYLRDNIDRIVRK